MSKVEDHKDYDIILLHSPTDDGEGMRALRTRPGKLDLTELRPVTEGQNVAFNEVVRLRPHEKIPFGYDVDVVYKPEKDAETEASADRSGPTRVSTKAYRKNWDRIFALRNANRPKNPLLN